MANQETAAVYRINAGKLTHGTCSSRLPAFTVHHFFKPGAETGHVAAIVEAIREIATRCAPDLTVLVGPQMWGTCQAEDTDSYECRAETCRREDGTVEYRHHGVAYTTRDLIMLAADDVLPHVSLVLHHELWHVLEWRLHPADLNFVDACASGGDSRPGGYLASGCERRARLYEFTASSWDEGARPICFRGVPVSRLERIFWHVYSGGLALDQAAGRRSNEAL